jgi:hypothetical protein
MIFTAQQILFRWRIQGLESVVCVSEKRSGKYSFVWVVGGGPEGKGPLELRVNERIILKRIRKNCNGKAWTVFITARDRKM